MGPAPPPTTQPDSAPAAGEAESSSAPADTQQAASAPAEAASVHASPAPRLRLYAAHRGGWTTLADLPDAVADAAHFSLAIHLGRPTLLFLRRGDPHTTLHALQLGAGGWQPLGPAPEPAATGPEDAAADDRPPPPLTDPAGRMPPLADLLAASIGNQLFLLGLPEQAHMPLHLARVREDGRLHDVRELTLQPPPGPDFPRHRRWDVTADDQRFIFVRVGSESDTPSTLQFRRYDPVNARFDADWEEVPGLRKPTGILPVIQSEYFIWIVMAVLAGLFLMRRPAGVIRIPPDCHLAPLLPRVAALAIDLVPSALVGYALGFGPDLSGLVGWVRGLVSGSTFQDPSAYLWYLWTLGVLAAYQGIAETAFTTTLGKRLFRLYVRSVRADRPAPWQTLLRSAVKLVELFNPYTFMITMLILLLHPARQRLGDMIAGTVIVSTRRPGGGWINPPPPGQRPPHSEDPGTEPRDPGRPDDDSPPDRDA
jgi:uncharacterized RDD family membrane protein YckC